jgi:hypothetical protein
MLRQLRFFFFGALEEHQELRAYPRGSDGLMQKGQVNQFASRILNPWRTKKFAAIFL